MRDKNDSLDPSKIVVERIFTDDKLILHHLNQLYTYDFSEFDGTDTDDVGLYPDGYIERYWMQENRHPYLVRVEGKLAGFAVVRLDEFQDGSALTRMAEFFIMRKYRGKGIGQTVAFTLFDLYSGQWEVSEVPENDPAQAFWRKIIGRYANGQFEERIEDQEVIQAFFSPGVCRD